MSAAVSDPDGAMDRRTFLRGVAGAGTLAVAGAGASAPAAAQDSGGDLDSWFEDVSNYDGVVDETGSAEVTVGVGAKGNDGAFAFGPAAVRVNPGTTVVWKWTGNGGSHNVAAEDGDFESETVGEAGHTFEQTFDEEGVYKYACTPHKPMGMKGAVVVGTEISTGSSYGSDSLESDSGESSSGSSDSAAASGSGVSRFGDYLTLSFGGALLVVLLGLPLAEARQRRQK